MLTLLAAWWILRIQGGLWRRTVWDEAGHAIRRVAGAVDGDVRPVPAGWSFEGTDGLRVIWKGGVLGPRTIVAWSKAGKPQRRRFSGFSSADEVLAAIDSVDR